MVYNKFRKLNSKVVKALKKIIYADNAATTKVSEEVLKEMLPYFTENYGNASSIYSLGQDAARAIVSAKERIAAVIGADPREIYFTSGGSESDNWAVRGIAEAMAKKGKKHIITSNIEHHAILHTCQYLEKNGFEVTYIPVGDNGIVNADDVRNAIREDTALVTVMFANNEIGTIQPIEEIAKICKESKVLFHTDAVQAIGNVPINVKEMGIDLMSVSGHKIHAQKGIGFLYLKRGVVLPNLIYGGGQENGKRPGTENVPAIMGLAKAVEIAAANIAYKTDKVGAMRDKLIKGLLEIDGTRLNGDAKKRLCGNVNVSILGIEGEFILMMLNVYGICASSGSACTSGSLDPSHVLLALGLPHEIAHGSLRLSISEETTDSDVDYIIEKVKQVAQRGREMSPLWERIVKSPADYQHLLKWVSPLK